MELYFYPGGVEKVAYNIESPAGREFDITLVNSYFLVLIFHRLKTLLLGLID